MLKDDVVLLVEDEDDDVVLAGRAFQKSAMTESLKVVRDGDQAIRYLFGQGEYANRNKYPLPFLVLLDLKMPKTDGFEVLQRVRSEPELKSLLIIVLSASNSKADVERAYELGANSYLLKPVDANDLNPMIQRFKSYWVEINRAPNTPILSRGLQPAASSS